MNEQPKPNKKPFFYYAMIAMLILMLLNAFVFPSLMTPRVTEVSYDKFLDMLSGGQVTVVELQENERELYFKAADENGAERIYSTCSRTRTCKSACPRAASPFPPWLRRKTAP